MSSKVGIIGAGAWGTAVAKVIADKGHAVDVWSHEEQTTANINNLHENTQFLPEVKLPSNLKASTDITEVANDKDFIILAAPSLFLLDTVKKILNVPSIREGETCIGVITKGFIETQKGPKLIVETLENYLPGFYGESLVYIAGPSHAEEVARGKITGLIAASANAKNSIRFKDLLKSEHLLVFASLDVRGVQIAAASKNVIAIAFGMLDALKLNEKKYGLEDIFGDGTESLLLAAGLNEIQKLGLSMGATHSETFTSISGVGDLDVTCRSVYGRNRRFGREIIEKNILSQFKNLDDLINRIGEVGYLPEGVVAAKYMNTLINNHKLKMPISSGVFRILNKEISSMELLDGILKELK
jgi:glycerol-3-phosphate dehydrogenase (NAD(P)+)